MIVDNVNNTEKACKKAQTLIDSDVLTDFYIADKLSEEVLKFFDIPRDSFMGGYIYSISELVRIYVCKSKYLLHFSSDSYIPHEFHWIVGFVWPLK